MLLKLTLWKLWQSRAEPGLAQMAECLIDFPTARTGAPGLAP